MENNIKQQIEKINYQLSLIQNEIDKFCKNEINLTEKHYRKLLNDRNKLQEIRQQYETIYIELQDLYFEYNL